MVDTRQLIEIAGFVASQLPATEAADRVGTADGLHRGWMAVRGLQRSWLLDLSPRESEGDSRASRTPVRVSEPPAAPAVLPFSLRRFAPAASPSNPALAAATAPASAPAPATTGGRSWVDAASEACVAEPAVRSWCAALLHLAQATRDPAPAQLATQLLGAQNQLRRRILLRLARESEQGVAHAPLDRLRRVGERWSDVFAGALCPASRLDELAIDSARAEELASGLRGTGRSRRVAWELSLAGLRTVYPAFPWSTPTRQRLAIGLAESLLGLLPLDLFTDAGPLVPSWWPALRRAAQ